MKPKKPAPKKKAGKPAGPIYTIVAVLPQELAANDFTTEAEAAAHADRLHAYYGVDTVTLTFPKGK